MADALPCAISFIGAASLLVGAADVSADHFWLARCLILAGAGFALASGLRDIAIMRWERQ
jgi:hypothetical protein